MTKLVEKKILHVTFNMAIGGTEQVIKQIIENSDESKYIHEILCIDGFIGPLGTELQSKGIVVHQIKRKQGFDINLIRSIRNLIKTNRYEVLHCHQYTPYFYGLIGALFTRAKIIFTEHGRFYPDRHNYKRRFINPFLTLFTSNIISISQSTADAVNKYEYIPRKKISVIYNGVKQVAVSEGSREELFEELGIDPGFRYVGTVSRLEPIKNQKMMIQAFSKVREKIPHIRLILIGDGSIKSELENLAKSLGLSDDVIFTGYIDNPQKFISLFEIFLLSSFSEGTSMTLLESMSLSIPCVVTEVGGNSEIVINNQTGKIVPSNNTELFACAIYELLMSDETRKKYGEMSKIRFLDNFDVSKMIQSYQILYSQEKT